MFKKLILSVKILLVIISLAVSSSQDSLFKVNGVSSNQKQITSGMPYLLSSLVIPGSGQYLMGHNVKGPVIFLTELLLVGSGANDGFYLTNKWQSRINNIEHSLSKPFNEHNAVFNGKAVSSDSLSLNDSLESYQGYYKYSESIRNRTLVWAAGFHLYNVLDCYQYISLSNRNPMHETSRSPKGAFLRSILLPGWGQFYNKEYSKMGMMLTAMAGFSMNIFVWNKTGNYYSSLKNKYRAIADPLQEKITSIQSQHDSYKKSLDSVEARLKKDTTLSPVQRDSLQGARLAFSAMEQSVGTIGKMYSNDLAYAQERENRYFSREKSFYSDRNQNIWFLFAVYMYAAFDAYVDAHLSGFERKMEFGLIPAPDGLALNINYHLK